MAKKQTPLPPPYPLTQNQRAFVRAAQRAKLTVDYAYSGRNMFGRQCPAVRCDPGQFGFRGASTDGMGKQIVVYMP